MRVPVHACVCARARACVCVCVHVLLDQVVPDELGGTRDLSVGTVLDVVTHVSYLDNV